jgi:hypothetical protein
MGINDGVRLDALLSRRRLSPGECAFAAAALATQLAGWHQEGRSHGDVRAPRILVVDGTVHLDGPDAEVSATPPDDVEALGRLLESAMIPGAPPLLRRLLATCRADDPADRPEAAELARLVVRACPATPIRLTLAPVPGQSWPSVRRVAVALGLALGLFGAIAAGRAWGGQAAPTGTRLPAASTQAAASVVLPSSSVPSSPRVQVARPLSTQVTPRQSAAVVDWGGIISGLDAARGQAFAHGRQDVLASVDVPGSPAWSRDAALVDALDRQGVVARGWRPGLEVVRVERRASARVVLQVRDRVPRYTLVSAGGVVRHVVPARGPRWWRLELREVDDAWRIWDAALSVSPGRLAS